MFTNKTRIMTTITAMLMVVFAVGVAAAGHGHGHDHGDKPSIFPIAKEAGFSTLIAAIEAAGLEKTLTEDGPFTVFAPTNDAFAKLPEGVVDALLKDKEALKDVLLYHVVAGKVTASEVVMLKNAKMLNGATIAIGTEDGVTIGDATVVKSNIEAGNGIIHVIDTVLIPSANR